MSGDSEFTSIADVLEAAARKSREDAAKLKPRILAAGGKPAASSAAGDLLDDFDYAIQAVQAARKSLPEGSAGVKRTAVTILIAKRRIPSPDANDLVTRAIHYLDD